MQDRARASLVAGVGDPAAKDEVLQEGHAAGILHSAGVEFRNEQLVVLAEGVADAEVGVVPIETLFGNCEEFVGVEVFGQRLAAVEAQVDTVVVIGGLEVRAGDQSREVGAEPGRSREVHGLGLAVFMPGVLHRADRAVGHHLPVRRSGHLQREAGFEIRLIEAGEHSLRIGGFELGVEVDLIVDRIDESMQALTDGGVQQIRVNHQHVVRGQLREHDPVLRQVVAHVDRLAVERHFVQSVRDDIDEGGGARPAGAEGNRAT